MPETPSTKLNVAQFPNGNERAELREKIEAGAKEGRNAVDTGAGDIHAQVLGDLK